MSRLPRIWLFASACVAGALLHLALPLGGTHWYSFVGAPQGLVAQAAVGSAQPVVSCVVIAALLSLCACYAFSALGLVRHLPARRVVLGIIGLGLALRAVWFPILAVTDPAALGPLCGRCSNLNGFVVATSALCLFIGIGYLLGAVFPNRTVHAQGRQHVAAT